MKRQFLVFVAGLTFGVAGWHGLGAMNQFSPFGGYARRNPVHFYAREKGGCASVQRLLDAGVVCIDALDEKGLTLLHKAAEGGNDDTASLLINNYHVDVNARDEYGRTALHLAASNGYGSDTVCVSVVRLLLVTPAVDVNALDNSGGTALHLAVSWGVLEAVKELLNARDGKENLRVNVQIRNKAGKTPVDIARERVIDCDEEKQTPYNVARSKCYHEIEKLIADRVARACP